MEPRAVTAERDGDGLKVWTSTQNVFGVRGAIASSLGGSSVASHSAGIPRRSGSELTVRRSSRIVETPSASAWWVLMWSAYCPSARPSIKCICHSGRDRSSVSECSSETMFHSAFRPARRGSALIRTW